jgi:hypothetical protein
MEDWTSFADLLMRLVGLAVSEADVERILSIHRDIHGLKANLTNAETLIARARLRQECAAD